jgi:DNA-directed RNA polymerase alpha subunit
MEQNMKIHHQGTYDRAEVLWPIETDDIRFDDVTIHIHGPREGRIALAQALTTVELSIEPPKIPAVPPPEVLATKIDTIELSIRAANCLSNAGIMTLGDLTKKTKTEMRSIHGFGTRSFNEVADVLHNFSLDFAEDRGNG